MPRLMVIVPARNAEDTVGHALRSTLRALPADAGVLVLDDASDDQTSARVEELGDGRVTLLRSETNLGVNAGLNHLLEHVDSELVARMDADDLCLPWRFHAQLRTLRKADVVFTTVTPFSQGPLRARPQSPVSLSPAATRLHLLLANPVAHSTLLGRTDHLRRVGGYRQVRSEDYDLWLRMCAAGSRLARAAVPGLLYRVHAQQVTAGTDWHAEAALDPGLQESYAGLSRQVLGLEPRWYAALRARVHGAPRTPDPDITRLRVGLTEAARGLSWRERRFLQAKVDKLLGTS